MHIIPSSPRAEVLIGVTAVAVPLVAVAPLSPVIFPVLAGVTAAMTAAGAVWVASTYQTATTSPTAGAPAGAVDPAPVSSRDGTLVPVTTSGPDVGAPRPDAPAPDEDAVLEFVRRAIESADKLEMLLVRARRTDETLTATEVRAAAVVQDVASTLVDHTEVVADGLAADARPRGV